MSSEGSDSGEKLNSTQFQNHAGKRGHPSAKKDSRAKKPRTYGPAGKILVHTIVVIPQVIFIQRWLIC